jgi:hypothetical protein
MDYRKMDGGVLTPALTLPSPRERVFTFPAALEYSATQSARGSWKTKTKTELHRKQRETSCPNSQRSAYWRAPKITEQSQSLNALRIRTIRAPTGSLFLLKSGFKIAKNLNS